MTQFVRLESILVIFSFGATSQKPVHLYIRALLSAMAKTKVKTKHKEGHKSEREQRQHGSYKRAVGNSKRRQNDRLSPGSFERQWDPSQNSQAIVEMDEEVSLAQAAE